MKEIHRDQLDPVTKAALKQTEAALENSYCPFSGLQVSAGLILDSGEVIIGNNYESASYGLTQCAERNAIGRAQSEGKISSAIAMVLAVNDLNNNGEKHALTPCGACRQWLAELCGRLERDLPVYSFRKGNDSGLSGTALNLLPKAFS